MPFGEKIYLKSVLEDYPHKRAQLARCIDINEHYTTTDDMRLTIEYYVDGVKRFIITGTRCRFVATFKGGYLIRKPHDVALRGVEDIWINARELL